MQEMSSEFESQTGKVAQYFKKIKIPSIQPSTCLILTTNWSWKLWLETPESNWLYLLLSSFKAAAKHFDGDTFVFLE